VHPVGPIITGGMLIYPLEQANEVARAYRDYVADAPDELATALAFFPAPPEPFIPERLHGETVLAIPVCHCGDLADGERVVRPLKEIGSPVADLLGPMPYTAFQALLDPTAPRGWHWYNTGEHLDDLSADAIDVLVGHAPEGLDPLSMVIVFRHGGAVSRIPEDATAFGNREAEYILHPLAAWLEPGDGERHLSWLRELVRAMEPFKTGGVYLNFTPDEREGTLSGYGADRIVDGYGAEKYARLVALKQKYDPENVFRFNHNVPPVESAQRNA
jgi:FAD/FMN-containing dehydrogenase